MNDKSLGWTRKHHSLSLWEYDIDVFDHFRRYEHRKNLDVWCERVLVKVPKVDLRELAVWFCDEHGFHPGTPSEQNVFNAVKETYHS